MNKEFVEVEGIMCEVKNPGKRSLVKQYQHNLRIETDKYIGEQTMTDKRKGYASALEINIKIAPFVLGWLVKPEGDEYRVITGRMTLDEFNKKNKPIAIKPKKESKPQKASKETEAEEKPQEKAVNKRTKKS
jgi:hypothetical protein